MLAGNERHAGECGMAVAVGDDIAKLDERVAVPYRLQAKLRHSPEPRLVEQVLRRLDLVAVLIHELERARHDKAHALLYAAREVRVGHGVAIDVVELLPGRVARIYRALPCPAPVLDVVFEKNSA